MIGESGAKTHVELLFLLPYVVNWPKFPVLQKGTCFKNFQEIFSIKIDKKIFSEVLES